MTLIRRVHLQNGHDGVVRQIEQGIANGLIRDLLLVAVIAGKTGQSLEAGELVSQTDTGNYGSRFILRSRPR